MAAVLLVEDQPDNRNIYKTILEFAGHTVFEATNGVEALASVRSRVSDVIVMDVTMPLMDGLEATRQLKGDPRTAAIPILVLTAHATSADREEAFAAGADAYLSKPCVPKDVLAEVERLLQPK